MTVEFTKIKEILTEQAIDIDPPPIAGEWLFHGPGTFTVPTDKKETEFKVGDHIFYRDLFDGIVVISISESCYGVDFENSQIPIAGCHRLGGLLENPTGYYCNSTFMKLIEDCNADKPKRIKYEEGLI